MKVCYQNIYITGSAQGMQCIEDEELACRVTVTDNIQVTLH